MSNYNQSFWSFILFVIVGAYPTYLLIFGLLPSLISKFSFPMFCFSLGLLAWILFFFFAFISTFSMEKRINWLLKNGLKVKAKIIEVVKTDLGDNDGCNYYFICQTKLTNNTQLKFKSKILKYDPTEYCNKYFNGEIDVYLNNSNHDDYFIDLRNY
jgi:hypothetical protein